MRRQRPDESEASAVRIADFPEAGAFAGSYGFCTGSSIPSSSGIGPVIGADFGGNSRVDHALAVWFDDADEVAWFAPHLVERIERDPA